MPAISDPDDRPSELAVTLDRGANRDVPDLDVVGLLDGERDGLRHGPPAQANMVHIAPGVGRAHRDPRWGGSPVAAPTGVVERNDHERRRSVQPASGILPLVG
jgi:hypothetical protein